MTAEATWTLRLATESDLTAIVRIEEMSQGAPWNKAQFGVELRQSGARLWVIETSEAIVGFVNTRQLGVEAELLNVAIDHASRQKGIAAQALTAVFQMLREDGVVLVDLEVRVSNVAAHRLYERLGFQTLGTRKRYYPDNLEDALVLRLNLPGKSFAPT